MYGFIYITTNMVNNKKYIGKSSYDKKDWKNYIGSGIVLNRAIKKYGKDKFIRKIIEECETKKLLNQRERYWIKFYNATNNENFYNVASGGDGGNVIEGYSDIQRQELSNKLSSIRKGIVNKGSKNGNAKKVICLNTMKIFNSIVEASIRYKITKESIQQCCSENSGLRTAGIDISTGDKLIWKYYIEGMSYFYKHYEKTKVESGKQVYCITTEETFSNIVEAGKKYNIKPSSISECCNYKLKSAGKHPITKERMVWIFNDQYLNNKNLAIEKIKISIPDKYTPKTKKVKCINSNIIFNSIKSASEWCGMNVSSNITEVCNGNRKHAGRHPTSNEKLLWEWVI